MFLTELEGTFPANSCSLVCEKCMLLTSINFTIFCCSSTLSDRLKSTTGSKVTLFGAVDSLIYCVCEMYSWNIFVRTLSYSQKVRLYSIFVSASEFFLRGFYLIEALCDSFTCERCREVRFLKCQLVKTQKVLTTSNNSRLLIL